MVDLNGQFATQGYWRKVIADLGPGFRHITYDERARGKSRRSADYSFEAAVRDVDAVLAARGWWNPAARPMPTRPGWRFRHNGVPSGKQRRLPRYPISPGRDGRDTP
ncbi:alpha/beta fold hydrolase [Nocardia uniformis]|uniref:alpha/beta fold hydrolase n=1 Tax=Nocardia uniformis TaxID=53432 RepID=UPI0008300C96|nr:hypothetical protein [Nocardia uniformis]